MGGPETSIPLRRALQKINEYLEVNKIGFTNNEGKQRKQTNSCLGVQKDRFHLQRATVKYKLVPRSQQNRLHQKKDTHNKGSKNASRSPKSTSLPRAPIRTDANRNQKRKARKLKDKRPHHKNYES